MRGLPRVARVFVGLACLMLAAWLASRILVLVSKFGDSSYRIADTIGLQAGLSLVSLVVGILFVVDGARRPTTQ